MKELGRRVPIYTLIDGITHEQGRFLSPEPFLKTIPADEPLRRDESIRQKAMVEVKKIPKVDTAQIETANNEITPAYVSRETLGVIKKGLRNYKGGYEELIGDLSVLDAGTKFKFELTDSDSQLRSGIVVAPWSGQTFGEYKYYQYLANWTKNPKLINKKVASIRTPFQDYDWLHRKGRIFVKIEDAHPAKISPWGENRF